VAVFKIAIGIAPPGALTCTVGDLSVKQAQRHPAPWRPMM
jgi:hypothetical protein